MIVYRLSKKEFADDLSGKGAEICGGRWNSKGVAMIYTSESRALCTAEIAVHTSLTNIPTDYRIITIEIPDNSIIALDINDFPEDWDAIPNSYSTQKLGNTFVVKNAFLTFKVPSAVVHGDFNYVINPRHKYINKVKIIDISPFSFDKRLFEK
ncbi:RES family NAD+ phosphorylase [Parabacteroides sp. Marseille-P3160]|uniref:RES family NAD+ phosphorylase n=1 Tax=Parabacteroides sp. Marseille-P3160 TaxID=1917887 RepID=UPI0009BA1FE1|nr:RES family NAD+ phosphorylase [Parabacteroides sp. Marseille-P3160]